MFIQRIWAIAFNTFREAVRDKILYSILFFAILMIGSSLLFTRLTLGESIKIVQDIGLASISIFGTLIAIFVGISLVNKEIERRTVYTIISKPIRRWEFILGKYTGLLVTLLLEVLIMTTCFMALLYYDTNKLWYSLLPAIALITVELCLITAFAILFSSFSTPTLSSLFTLSVYVVGHSTEDIRRFGGDSEIEFVKKGSEILYYILPNLENFNVKNQVVHDVAISPMQYQYGILYGVLYSSIVLILSMTVFSWRDFK